MFYTCLSFCSQGGGCLPKCMLGYTPRTRGRSPLLRTRGRHPWTTGRHPPAQCMLGDMGNKWAVRILLESILVQLYNLAKYEKVQKPEINKCKLFEILQKFSSCIGLEEANFPHTLLTLSYITLSRVSRITSGACTNNEQ